MTEERKSNLGRNSRISPYNMNIDRNRRKLDKKFCASTDSMFSGQEIAENEMIQIYLNIDNDNTECYNRTELKQWFENQHIDEDPDIPPMTSWETEETKNRDVLFRLPWSNTWITENSAKLLACSKYKVFLTYKHKNIPIGSVYGASRIHGDVTRVWEIKPLDNNIRDIKWKEPISNDICNLMIKYNINKIRKTRENMVPSIEDVAIKYKITSDMINELRSNRFVQCYYNWVGEACDTTVARTVLCEICLLKNSQHRRKCKWCDYTLVSDDINENCEENGTGCIISFTKVRKPRVRKSIRKSVKKPRVRKSVRKPRERKSRIRK